MIRYRILVLLVLIAFFRLPLGDAHARACALWDWTLEAAKSPRLRLAYLVLALACVSLSATCMHA